MTMWIYIYFKHDMDGGQCEKVIGLNAPPTGGKRTAVKRHKLGLTRGKSL